MDPDHRIRAAAFVAVSQLSRRFNDHVPWQAISNGFSVADERILFANQAKGIFKPKQMSAALSIKTTVPQSGRTRWYRDQDPKSSNLDGATGLLRYELARGNDPTNEALRKVWQRGAHLIRNDRTYAESPSVVQCSHQGGLPKPMCLQWISCARAPGRGAHPGRQGWRARIGAKRNLHVDAAPCRFRLASHRSRSRSSDSRVNPAARRHGWRVARVPQGTRRRSDPSSRRSA